MNFSVDSPANYGLPSAGDLRPDALKVWRQADPAVFWPIFKRSLHPMLMADDEGSYRAANAAACLLLRLPADEVLRRTVADLTPPERRPMLSSTWKAFLEQGTTGGTYDLLLPDGTRFPVEGAAVTDVFPQRHLAVLIPNALGQSREKAIDTRPEHRGTSPTPREIEVLTLIALGATGVEIAQRLVLSPDTVRTHVRNAMNKLGASTRAHAITIALRQGMILLD